MVATLPSSCAVEGDHVHKNSYACIQTVCFSTIARSPFVTVLRPCHLPPGGRLGKTLPFRQQTQAHR